MKCLSILVSCLLLGLIPSKTHWPVKWKPVSNWLVAELQHAVKNNDNVFEVLMEASRYCSLGQITDTFFEVGGQYRRNM